MDQREPSLLLQSIEPLIDSVRSATCESQKKGKLVSGTENYSFREKVSIVGFLALFATLLALITSRHEMFLDEVQPWLIVRNAHGILPVIQHLRYECHPALWFVLLYIASRISSNVITMQCVNFVLAVSMALVVLSARTLPMAVRVLIVFGVSVFYVSGVLARDYMLAGLLLTFAARCFVARPQRHWLGMVSIALAINSHFLAIPVALSIVTWLYVLSPAMDLASVKSKLRERRFWTSVALIAIALIVCYFTVRPAADITARRSFSGGSLLGYFVLCVGRVCHYFLPVSPDANGSIQNGSLALPAYVDFLATSFLFLIALSALPSKRGRYFVITASVLWATAATATVGAPTENHTTFIFVSFAIGLLANRPEDRTGSWLPSYVAEPLLLALLSIQVAVCAEFCIKEWTSPFSSGKPVAEWLEAAGLAGHPLVAQSQLSAPAVLAYTGMPTAYFTACRCSFPFVLYSRAWQNERQVSREELEFLKSSTGKSPVVLSGWQISQNDQRQLGLHLVYESPKGWGFRAEDVFVYLANDVQAKL